LNERIGLRVSTLRVRAQSRAGCRISGESKICDKEERLLLMACSYGKADVRPGQPVGPIDLYTGVMFETLKKGLPDLDQTRIIILSPKHGLVGKEWLKIAPYYNRPSPAEKRNA
jgi:hypothetical protein